VTKMDLFVASATVLLFAVPASSQSSQTKLQLSATETTITVHESGQQHAYEFDDDDLQLHEIDEAKLVFQSRKNGELYLVMDVTGPSVGGGNGPCGAGEEEYLIWLALDSKWHKDDQRLEPIASCFLNIGSTGSEPYVIKDGKLTAEYIESKEDNKSLKDTLIYDSAKPEKGWIIEKKRQPVPGER
jgi:hypothetical protein